MNRAEDVGGDPTDFLGQEQRRNDDKLDADRKRKQEADDIRWLMAHKQGRRILWRVLEQAGIYRTSFTGNSETFFREGKRALGLFLLSDVHEFAPDSYVTMLKERKSDDS